MVSMTPTVYPDRDGLFHELSGVERAAALLLSMGKPLAGRILKHFDEIELREVARAAAQLGSVSRNNLEDLVDDFAESFKSGIDLQGGVGEVEQMLADALPPDQAAHILSDLFGGEDSHAWDKISALPEGKLAAYLEREHSQTATMVLSKLDSSSSAAILSKMSRNRRNEVVMRMIGTQPVSDHALKIAETAIMKDLLNDATPVDSDSRARVADIVNKLEASDVEDVLKTIEQTKPGDAAALKKLLFTFDDLVRLSVRARSTLFDALPTETVVLCLRGTEVEFRENVLSAMASRSRRLVESELANASSAQQKDILKARRTVVETVLRLAQRNEIEISSPDDDAEAA
jgi:flagellar motor switch protein FliG